MRFTLLDAATDNLIVYLVAAVIGLVIFYFIIKNAVKNGMIEAQEQLNRKPTPPDKAAVLERPANPAQWELQKKYDAGQISFEEYKQEWNKL